MINRDLIIKRLNKLPKELLHVIFLSRNLAKSKNVGVYLVGGCVRDLLLNVDNLDLDIVVERDGIEFAYELSKLFDARLVKHKAFGTATIIRMDGLKIDIATSRREFYPKPAVLPIVSQGGIEDDLARRDFTINAMACHIDDEKFGQFVDIFDGLGDLKKGCIRFLHEKSFIDDPTRIIRAVRFEQRFGFKIEPKTLHFIKEAKKLKMLEEVQKHRIRDEIILIFREKNLCQMLMRLKQIYNLSFIDRDIKLNKNLKSVFSAVNKYSNWFHSIFSEKRKLDIWLLYFMFFLFPLRLARLHQFLAKYAFHSSDRKRIVSFKKEFSKIDNNLSKGNLSAVKLHSLLHPLSYEVIILILSVSKNKGTNERIKEFFIEHHHKKIAITGQDLLDLGIKPSPEFKKIFQKVFQAKINGKIHTKEEELEFAKKIINKFNY